MPDLYAGAVGTSMRWMVEDDCETLDVSTASLKQVKFTRPDATEFTRDLNYVTDGTDGLLEYIVENGVFIIAGTYKWQLLLQIGGWRDHSAKGTFIVGEILF